MLPPGIKGLKDASGLLKYAGHYPLSMFIIAYLWAACNKATLCRFLNKVEIVPEILCKRALRTFQISVANFSRISLKISWKNIDKTQRTYHQSYKDLILRF